MSIDELLVAFSRAVLELLLVVAHGTHTVGGSIAVLFHELIHPLVLVIHTLGRSITVRLEPLVGVGPLAINPLLVLLLHLFEIRKRVDAGIGICLCELLTDRRGLPLPRHRRIGGVCRGGIFEM